MNGDKIDFVKMVVVESIPSVLFPKQVELEMEKDPKLISLRQDVMTGDWSKCKLPRSLPRCQIDLSPRDNRGQYRHHVWGGPPYHSDIYDSEEPLPGDNVFGQIATRVRNRRIEQMKKI